MKLKKLFKELKLLKERKKEYYIEPTIRFYIEDNRYCFSLFPTICFMPWIYRHPESICFDIWWLNFHIYIGKFKVKKEGGEAE